MVAILADVHASPPKRRPESSSMQRVDSVTSLPITTLHWAGISTCLLMLQRSPIVTRFLSPTWMNPCT